MPKTVQEALNLDKENGNTLWYDANAKEMKNVRVAFKEWKGKKKKYRLVTRKLNVTSYLKTKISDNF